MALHFHKFRYWIQTTLPAYFYDDITLYETVAKLAWKVNDALEQIEDAYNELEDYVHTEIDGMHQDITNMQNQINQFETDMTNKFNQLETSVNNTLTTINQKIEELDELTSNLVSQWDTMKSQLEQLQSDLEELQTEVEQTLSQVTSKVTELEGEIDSLTALVNGYNQRITNLETDVQSILEQLEQVEGFDTFSVQPADLTTDLSTPTDFNNLANNRIYSITGSTFNSMANKPEDIGAINAGYCKILTLQRTRNNFTTNQPDVVIVYISQAAFTIGGSNQVNFTTTDAWCYRLKLTDTPTFSDWIIPKYYEYNIKTLANSALPSKVTDNTVQPSLAVNHNVGTWPGGYTQNNDGLSTNPMIMFPFGYGNALFAAGKSGHTYVQPDSGSNEIYTSVPVIQLSTNAHPFDFDNPELNVIYGGNAATMNNMGVTNAPGFITNTINWICATVGGNNAILQIVWSWSGPGNGCTQRQRFGTYANASVGIGEITWSSWWAVTSEEYNPA